MDRSVPDRAGAVGIVLRLSAAAGLALLVACGGAEMEASDLPPGVEPLPAGAHIAMPAPHDPVCQPPSMRKVFREEPEWNGYWMFGLGEHCPHPQLPEGFDFSREMLVLASMGPRESPADSIAVLGAGVVNDTVRVVVRRTTRQEGCPAENARVWPRDLVRLPADARPVRFLEEQRKRPCPG